MDGDVINGPQYGRQTDPVFPEQFSESVTVDEIDGCAPSRVASACALTVYVPVVISNPRSPRPAIAPRNFRTSADPTDPA
jgi:hypothetical protein